MKRKINAYAVCFNPKNLHVVSSDFCFDTDFPCDICDICDICGKWYKSALDLDYHKKKYEASLKSADIPWSKTYHVCDFCIKTF